VTCLAILTGVRQRASAHGVSLAAPQREWLSLNQTELFGADAYGDSLDEYLVAVWAGR
jgi:hypothetical protein